MRHSDKCLKLQEKYKALQAEFILKYPNYCRHCNARGGYTYYDAVPWGSDTAQMPSYEYCEYCLGIGLCPRCSQSLSAVGQFEEKYLPCYDCGWDETHFQDSLPEYECYFECMYDKDDNSVADK